jgi:GAF domain-containing protein
MPSPALPPRQTARGSGGDLPDPGLARDLSDLARRMQADTSMESLLVSIVDAAVREVEGAEYAGISEILGRQVNTRAASDPLVSRIDALQYDAGEGPCLTSLREQVTVRSADLEVDDRWPGFASAAADIGVRSMLAVQLYVEGDNLGALNMYAGAPGAFTPDDETVALLLAAHAAVAIQGSRNEHNLQRALDHRDVIGQAKGILMERYKVDHLTAFHLLNIASQRTNRKLYDVAEDLAATGEVPSPAFGQGPPRQWSMR